MMFLTSRLVVIGPIGHDCIRACDEEEGFALETSILGYGFVRILFVERESKFHIARVRALWDSRVLQDEILIRSLPGLLDGKGRRMSW
jgi:hypothetical protein